jgi:hypothetical protein
MCPESEDLYCSNPFDCLECPGFWNCDDIAMIADDMIYSYDTNEDG